MLIVWCFFFSLSNGHFKGGILHTAVVRISSILKSKFTGERLRWLEKRIAGGKRFGFHARHKGWTGKYLISTERNRIFLAGGSFTSYVASQPAPSLSLLSLGPSRAKYRQTASSSSRPRHDVLGVCTIRLTLSMCWFLILALEKIDPSQNPYISEVLIRYLWFSRQRTNLLYDSAHFWSFLIAMHMNIKENSLVSKCFTLLLRCRSSYCFGTIRNWSDAKMIRNRFENFDR